MDFGTNFGNLMWFVCKFCGKADLDQRKMEWHEWNDHLKNQDRSKPEPQPCFMGLPFDSALKSQLPSHSAALLQQQQQLQQQLQQQAQQQVQQHQQQQHHHQNQNQKMAERSLALKRELNLLHESSGNSSLFSVSDIKLSLSAHNQHHSSVGAPASSSSSSANNNSASSSSQINGQIPSSLTKMESDSPNNNNNDNRAKKTRNKTGKPKSKNFQCSHCQKMFSSSQNLTVHIRTHLGERPYVCRFPDNKTGEKCEKAFTNQSNRDTHERLHTGIKPFKCSFCEKTFTNSSNRTMHERIHTGIRPYKCDECSSSYTSSSNLKNHKKTHFVFSIPS